MKNKFFMVLALGVFLLTHVNSASAVTIVDTGTTGGGTAWTLNYSQWLAGKFTITENQTITSLEGFMRAGNASTGTSLTAAIYSDGSNLPGTELYSQQFLAAGTSNSWYGATGLNWNLGPGTYWAAFEIKTGDTYDGVLFGSGLTPLEGWATTGMNGGSFDIWRSTTSVLNLGIRIMGDAGQGIPVPEPGSMMLLGVGMVSLILYTKRRCRKD